MHVKDLSYSLMPCEMFGQDVTQLLALSRRTTAPIEITFSSCDIFGF